MSSCSTSYDAVVIGSGPNGLSAAITLQQAGLSVLVVEAKETIGGGARSAGLTLPGFTHDICSAIHPLAAASPFFTTLPLHDYGLRFIYPDIDAAHPFDDGSAAVLCRSIQETAGYLGKDGAAYTKLIEPFVYNWSKLAPELLGPLHVPDYPLTLAAFGLKGLTASTYLAKKFSTEQAKGLLAGMAAHSIQPLTNWGTSAIALVLLTAGHAQGWPIIQGGSQRLSDALADYFIANGGTIETNRPVKSMNDIPTAKATLFDVTPKQLMAIAGDQFSGLYKWQLNRFRYGMGVFKIDWALQQPIPFTNEQCRKAATVHLGGTLNEIASAEQDTEKGKLPARPFVLLAQQSLFDASRAPAGKHTAWAYCHVPNGSLTDMTNAIEQQVERFAPGFKEMILGRHTMNTAQMEIYNPNYVGGDINGGVIDIRQLFTRPVISLFPYRTSARGIYICSSSTPPGGGVHGMCGYHAARSALKEVFNRE